jgi:tetratricopeptide (TPR) repeat protein
MKAKLSIVLVLLVLMISGVPVQRAINDQRTQLKLRVGVEGLQPDEIFSTMCLAGFRGVAVDYLWVKALGLQMEKKWHEVRALSELIARLQPHFPTVWVFNSWNLSYNISVEWNNPEDQWKWIKEGLAYLDEGLERNPESVQIYFQKGWTYYHKIGQDPSEGPKQYFKTKLLEEEGLNNYEEAARWFFRCQQYARSFDDAPQRQHPFLAKAQVEGMYARAVEARAEELLQEGDLEKAIEKYEEVLAELEVLVQRSHEGIYGPTELFDTKYQDVRQKLYQLRILLEMQQGTGN